MSKARIVGGIWTRNVPWEKHGEWRADIFKSVLADSRLQQARFVLKDSPTVLIPAEELRRVLVGGHDHYHGHKIWGPFTINPKMGTIEGQQVQMHLEAPDIRQTQLSLPAAFNANCASRQPLGRKQILDFRLKRIT